MQSTTIWKRALPGRKHRSQPEKAVQGNNNQQPFGSVNRLQRSIGRQSTTVWKRPSPGRKHQSQPEETAVQGNNNQQPFGSVNWLQGSIGRQSLNDHDALQTLQMVQKRAKVIFGLDVLRRIQTDMNTSTLPVAFHVAANLKMHSIALNVEISTRLYSWYRRIAETNIGRLGVPTAVTFK